MALKYDLLGAYLAAQPADVIDVRLSFHDVERIALTALPSSARTVVWWRSGPYRGYTRAWTQVGWVVREVDVRQLWVVFTRQGPPASGAE